MISRVLLATIRDKGLFPCPRCLVPKTELQNLGLKRDQANREKNHRLYRLDKVDPARRAIYNHGMSIRSSAVEALLRGFSGVPTLVGASELFVLIDGLVWFPERLC